MQTYIPNIIALLLVLAGLHLPLGKLNQVLLIYAAGMFFAVFLIVICNTGRKI